MLRNIGGVFSGIGLSIIIVGYMDDIMYIPLKRAFIRPIQSYYVTNFAPQLMPGSTLESKMSINELADQLSEEGRSVFNEIRPRSVTSDSIKELINDSDYRSREDHYFGYIQRVKGILFHFINICIRESDISKHHIYIMNF